MINFKDMHEKVRKILEARVKEQDDDDLPDLPPKPGVKLDKDRTPAEIAARKKKKASDDQVIAIGRQKRLNKDDDDDDASEARIVRKTKKKVKEQALKAFKKGVKVKELSNDQIERDQEEDEQDDIDTKTKASAKSGQAVEATSPGDSDVDKESFYERIASLWEKEDKKWIQKAVDPEHKGYCTPMTKSTCTPARKALAKRFKKAARKEKKSGGTGWQGKV